MDRVTKLTIDTLDEGSRDYLRKLPRECHFSLDGVSFYINHTAPNSPINHYLDLEMPQSEVGSYYETFQEDILITGHTHRPYIKKIKNSLLVNPGSVGGQRDGVNLPQFNGHFKKYTEEYTIRKKEASNERGTANI
jgi:putative phosphoesterase